ncbi:MAG TPA: patatin-like phospholipase family protein [Vicinamibacterales bacterium]|nr:patatin-like phospholipase family protein [Vicinamibacterales bacterium]
MSTPDAPDRSYSTRLRTALLLTGTGTAGAYHAGVLRALHEAGIKIDLVGGRGVGAASALLAAIDGGTRVWEPSGIWKGPAARRFYGWRTPLRYAGLAVGIAGIVFLIPIALLALAVLVGLFGMLATLLGLESAGAALTTTYTRWIDALFAPAALPTVVPRLVLFTLLVAAGILAAAALVGFLRERTRRRARAGSFWRLFSAPLSAAAIVDRCASEIWSLIRGAAPLAIPSHTELARKYVDLLADNLGQPGFRELLLLVHDIDARRDLVFCLLAPDHRGRFFSRTHAEPELRQAEAFDLAGAARDHVVDALAAALSVPLATDPHLITFAADGPWRGETHRLCDRPDALGRLVEEAVHAGAEQIILVAPSPMAAKAHELSASRSDLRGRAGEQLAAFEAASLRDVQEQFAGRFAGFFVIRPAHHPLGSFDFAGVYDERSDRVQTLGELVDRGYEDAYRQFIEPVVGAGSELADPVHRASGGQPAPIEL